ncbi:MAG: YraN family protein [Magnetococcus sp. YQC-9]
MMIVRLQGTSRTVRRGLRSGAEEGVDSKWFGFLAEGVAARHLKRIGYRILARNWRSKGGEIDLVAWRDETLIFCEIKARHVATGREPGDAIDVHKRRRLVQLADNYLRHHPEWEGCACRFDAILVWRAGWCWQVEVIADAFRPGWE